MASTPFTDYEPWRADEHPRLKREITKVVWSGGLLIAVAENATSEPSLLLRFPHARAYQGVDEGYRLLDSPDWRAARALIYSSRTSPYLARFRENAATCMDNFPLVHWLIASCNECVDVLSETEPEITVTPRPQG